MSEQEALAGVRVLDFTWMGVGPLATKHLADHGAQVIKIESTTHLDGTRRAAPYAGGVAGYERSGYFFNLNSSKLGVTLNMRHPRAREIALRLAASSDVVAENFSAGVMEKWGLGYEDIRQVKPDIIMLTTSMMGRTGPHRDYLGYGTVLQSAVGLTYITGWPDRAPSSPSVAYTDWTVPHFAALALLAALDYRRRTGRGQHIDVSQMEAGIHALGPAVLDFAVNGRSQERAGNSLMAGTVPYAAPHGAYRCKGNDRWCVISVTSDEQWGCLVQALGSPKWAQDSQLVEARHRVRRSDEIDAHIQEWTEQRHGHDVMKLLQSHGVPCGVVLDESDIAQDPQLRHRGHTRVLRHPETGDTEYDAPAWRFGSGQSMLSPAPLLGQHNEEVYRGLLGMSELEYEELLLDGAFE